MRKQLTAALALIPAALLLAGCSTDTGHTAGEMDIVTTTYPLTYVAERVGGTAVTVTNVGTGDAHDLELSARQIGQIEAAPVVFYFGDHFQPAVESALGDQGLDGLEGVKATREGDPHVWLNPMNMADLGDQLATALAEEDPALADYFFDNADALRADMVALNDEFTAGLSQCEATTIVTSHAAFGYMTDAYGLEQNSIAGIDPESEPSPARLAEVAQYLADNKIDTVYFDANDASEQQIADALGVTVSHLETMETTPTEGDYQSVMRANLAALQAGLGC